MSLLEAVGLGERPDPEKLSRDVALRNSELLELRELLEQHTLLGFVVSAQNAERVEPAQQRIGRLLLTRHCRIRLGRCLRLGGRSRRDR